MYISPVGFDVGQVINEHLVRKKNWTFIIFGWPRGQLNGTATVFDMCSTEYWRWLPRQCDTIIIIYSIILLWRVVIFPLYSFLALTILPLASTDRPTGPFEYNGPLLILLYYAAKQVRMSTIQYMFILYII